MSDLISALQAAAGNAGEETDPYFNQTTLLLHGDGNQGATNFNNTGTPVYLAFKDNSVNNFPIDINGGPYGDNFGPYALPNGNWSNYFDGSGDYLQLAATTDLIAPSGTDYTLEFWFNAGRTTNSNALVASYPSGTNGNWIVWFDSGKIGFYQFPTISTNVLESTTTIATNTWYHFALCREGSTTRLFLNGALEDSITVVYDLGISTNPWTIGVYTSNYYQGYLSNLSFLKGTAKYTSAFTPSTTPLTPSATNQKLLTCYSNRFVDANTATTAKTITVNGNVSVQVLNPFNELPDGVNGSGYFDGVGDWIQITSPTSSLVCTADFTLEFWLYSDLTSDSYVISQYRASAVAGDFLLYVNTSGGGLWYLAGSSASPRITFSNGTFRANEWQHAALVRVGSTVTFYVNGVSVGTATKTTAFGVTDIPYEIASYYTNTLFYKGYISNVRLVNGTAVYTAAFTPPTAPLTAITNTSLLTCQYAGTVRNVGFIDSGPYDFPITRNGNTTQGTFSPFSLADGQWSNYFDGVTDYLYDNTLNTAYDFGSGDFTIEAWLYPQASGIQMMFVNYTPLSGSPPATSFSYFFTITSGNKLRFTLYSGSTGYTVEDTTNMTLNTWTHVAVTRESGEVRLFRNGVIVDSDTFNVSINASDSTRRLQIGTYNLYGQTDEFNGYISNVRIVKGTAVYTSAFTPPTAPLTAIANTSLLTCQSNRFVDNSINNFAITRNGNTSPQPFSPFAPSAAYSPSVNGGSGFFDGSGDTLSVSGVTVSFSTRAYTIEFWIYITVATASRLFERGTGSTDFSMDLSNTGVLTINNNTTISGSTCSIPIGINTWTHVALSRASTSASSTRWFINGVLGGTFTHSTNIAFGGTLTIGSALNGYLSGLRIVNGTALYTSAFTPPTAPPTVASNTSLLCNFTNAGILDNTGKNVLETVGDSRVDTTIVKFGTGSMEFDGTGDWLLMPSSQNFAFGSGDFTVEMWVYITNGTPTFQGLFSATGSGATNSFNLTLRDERLRYTNYSTEYMIADVGDAISLNTWTHVALTRESGTARFFKDGVLIKSVANTVAWTASPFVVGNGFANAYPFYGLIDDLRVTTGVARYTATFTPPEAPFPNQ